MQSPTMDNFVEWYQNLSKPIIEASLKKANEELSNVKGFIDDIEDKQEEISIKPLKR
jgi:flagellin-specific chaperone FliS